jgi:hypothetical protein
VDSGDNHAKFWLKPVILASSFGFNSSELNQLRKMIEKQEAFWCIPSGNGGI